MRACAHHPNGLALRQQQTVDESALSANIPKPQTLKLECSRRSQLASPAAAEQNHSNMNGVLHNDTSVSFLKVRTLPFPNMKKFSFKKAAK